MTNTRNYRGADENSGHLMEGARLKHWTEPNESQQRLRDTN